MNEHFSAVKMDEFDRPPFSLFLAKDHGLDTSTKFCIVDIDSSTMIFWLDFFTNFSFKDAEERKNLAENECEPKLPEVKSGLNVVCCLEYPDRYELDVAVRGVEINAETGEL